MPGARRPALAIRVIADSSALQAQNLSQINAAVCELDRSTQQNAALAEQSTAAATSLTREAGLLNEALARFSVAGPRQAPVQSAPFGLSRAA